jgi:competence protein ComEA
MKKVKCMTLLVALSFITSLCITVPSFAAGEPAKAIPSKQALAGKININSATAEQLEVLPRIGAKTAQSIVEYRTQNGAFKKVEDLVNVKGIGEKMFEELRSYIILEGETTLKKE